MPNLILPAFLFVVGVFVSGCSGSASSNSPTATVDGATTSTSTSSAAARNTPAIACTDAEVERLVTTFIQAFNRGDTEVLDHVFAKEPGFEWYSTDRPGARLREPAYDRATLSRYFAARHARRGRLRLRSFRFSGNTHEGGGDSYGNFGYGLVRSADDLKPTRYHGKGAARCYEDGDVIFVWSMARE